MRFRTVEELAALGLLEPKPADPARVGRWLERSRTDHALAADVLAQLHRDRAMAVAYEAGYRACAGLDTPPAASTWLRRLPLSSYV